MNFYFFMFLTVTSCYRNNVNWYPFSIKYKMKFDISRNFNRSASLKQCAVKTFAIMEKNDKGNSMDVELLYNRVNVFFKKISLDVANMPISDFHGKISNLNGICFGSSQDILKYVSYDPKICGTEFFNALENVKSHIIRCQISLNLLLFIQLIKKISRLDMYSQTKQFNTIKRYPHVNELIAFMCDNRNRLNPIQLSQFLWIMSKLKKKITTPIKNIFFKEILSVSESFNLNEVANIWWTVSLLELAESLEEKNKLCELFCLRFKMAKQNCETRTLALAIMSIAKLQYSNEEYIRVELNCSRYI